MSILTFEGFSTMFKASTNVYFIYYSGNTIYQQMHTHAYIHKVILRNQVRQLQGGVRLV